jgi:hypothetical protein
MRGGGESVEERQESIADVISVELIGNCLDDSGNERLKVWCVGRGVQDASQKSCPSF